MSVRRLLPLFLVLCGSVAGIARADDFASDRQLFRQTREQLQRHQYTRARHSIDELQKHHYPLVPYAKAALLETRLDDLPRADVARFLKRNAGTVVADNLRDAWLQALAKHKQWPDYLAYYDAANADRTEQCWHIEALHQAGLETEALAETGTLWPTATDLPSACDDALDRWLAAAPSLRDTRLWQRLLLALDHRRESLAAYLADKLGPDQQPAAKLALQIYRQPQQLAESLPQLKNDPHRSQLLAIGLQQLARSDIDSATRLWQDWTKQQLLSSDDSFNARNAIGRQLISQRGIDALPWLIAADPKGTDPYLLEWRVRLGLADGDWNTIADWIELMPETMATTSRWRYWYARALAASSDAAKEARAHQIYSDLADERSYYGFLAADHIAQPYHLNHHTLRPDVSTASVAALPALRRAHELYLLGDLQTAYREWSQALATMSAGEKQASALLADQWGWHTQALRLATLAGGYNDLDLRFPIAYRHAFTRAARKRDLQPQWLFAVARQESAFMPAARSPAGAVGLLQLMPATAKMLARQMGVHYDRHALTDPEHNIPLGSKYLSDLLDRFDGNRILATAAYNAGPARVARLLAQQPHPLSMDVWVETFPIRETREYVQSVMAFAVIYSKRLGQHKTQLVASNERVIGTQVEVSRAEQADGDQP